MPKIAWFPLHNLPFDRLARILATLGWRRAPDSTSAPDPWVAGEPDFALWKRPDAEASSARLHALYEPATGVRSLRLEAEPAEFEGLSDALARTLPIVDDAEILAALSAEDESTLLRALQTAEQRRDASFTTPLNTLLAHPSHTVRNAARRALTTILEGAAQQSMQRLQTLSERVGEPRLLGAPQRVLFLSKGLRERRQIVRWLAHGPQTITLAIEAVLEAAFEDGDWELRMTGTLVAARLRAVDLIPHIRALALPTGVRDGINSADARLIAGLRAAALALLQGTDLPADPLYLETRQQWSDHLLRCAAGAPVAHCERGFLWAHTLTTPVDASPLPDAPSIPEGFDLCWVGVGDYWLGDALPQSPPICSVSGGGFWIARTLHRTPDGSLWRGTLAEAQALCASLAEEIGYVVRMPAPEEWEMAARGMDGRRFPWGNALLRRYEGEASPWGPHEMVGIGAQWLHSAGESWLAGGERQLACAARIAPGDDERACLRLLVEAK